MNTMILFFFETGQSAHRNRGPPARRFIEIVVSVIVVVRVGKPSYVVAQSVNLFPGGRMGRINEKNHPCAETLLRTGRVGHARALSVYYVLNCMGTKRTCGKNPFSAFKYRFSVFISRPGSVLRNPQRGTSPGGMKPAVYSSIGLYGSD